MYSRRVRNRARTRTTAPVYSDTSEQSTASAAPSESRRIRGRSRMRARLPRRQGSQVVDVQQQNRTPQPKELYRDERTIAVATEAPTRSRSRSRSRHRVAIPSREAPTTEGYSEQRVASTRLSSRSRLRERGRGGVESAVREKKYTSPRSRSQDNYSSRRSSVSARDKAEPSRAQRPKEPPRSSQSSSRIRFPKKNLFGNKVSLKLYRQGDFLVAANLLHRPTTTSVAGKRSPRQISSFAIYLSSPSRSFTAICRHLQSPVVSNVTQDSLLLGCVSYHRCLSLLPNLDNSQHLTHAFRGELLTRTCASQFDLFFAPLQIACVLSGHHPCHD